MKKVFLSLLFVTIIILPVDAKTLKKHTYNHIKIYFYNNNINIKTKTYNGWIRVLLSKNKRKKYHIYLTKHDIDLYIQELKTLKSLKIQGKL